jgi:hypothetical protein
VVVDALSRWLLVMPLIFDLDRMGITFYYADVAHEETKMLIQLLLNRFAQTTENDSFLNFASMGGMFSQQTGKVTRRNDSR